MNFKKVVALTGTALMLSGCRMFNEPTEEVEVEEEVVEEEVSNENERQQREIETRRTIEYTKNKDGSIKFDTDDFYRALVNLEYDPYEHPGNYVEIEVEDLTKEQIEIMEEFGTEDAWTNYRVDSNGRPTQATGFLTKVAVPPTNDELMEDLVRWLQEYKEMENDDIKALIDTLPTERPSFSSSTRAGGELVKGYYDPDRETWTQERERDGTNNAELDLIGYSGWLYNKSHLIAWSLGGNMKSENIILGTRAQNVGTNFEGEHGGMRAIEAPVHEILTTDDEAKIFYQAIPIYQGHEVMPRGVYVRAYSVNDKGKTINKAIYTFNTQDGIKINYLTGEWEIVSDEVSVIDKDVK